jgi:dTDP-4-amino-4,6-dideoxygalactose transaminase
MLTLTERKVPFFNYPHVFSAREPELASVIAEVGRRGAFILQEELEAFERNLARHIGAKYALGVANGTDALIIALRCAGIGQGDEVIFCTHTYVATAASIHFVGATPVPVECRADHMICPASVEAAVTPRTRAIMPTQLNGRTCDMDALRDIADRHGLLTIEDAAQALGSRFQNRSAGTFGLAGTISFYPAKTLGALGDGGAILTDDEDLFEAMRRFRDHGRNRDGLIVGWGLNSRLDNLQAAVLDLKLKHYDEDVARRREIAAKYQDRLGDIPSLRLPPAPVDDSRHFDVYQNYEIEADSRDELKSFLHRRGIGTLVQWGGRLVHQLDGLGFTQSLPRAESMITRSLMLPMNPSLCDEDVEYVCDAVQEFYADRNPE